MCHSILQQGSSLLFVANVELFLSIFLASRTVLLQMVSASEHSERKPLNGMTNVRHLIGLITSHLIRGLLLAPINYVRNKFVADVSLGAKRYGEFRSDVLGSPEAPTLKLFMRPRDRAFN